MAARDDRKKYRVNIHGSERVLLLSAEDAANYKYAELVDEKAKAPAAKGRTSRNKAVQAAENKTAAADVDALEVPEA